MQKWLHPLDQVFLEADSDCHMFIKPGLMPDDATITATENGSMEKALHPVFIMHLDNFLRTFASVNDTCILTIDAHGSRNGYEWLEKCVV